MIMCVVNYVFFSALRPEVILRRKNFAPLKYQTWYLNGRLTDNAC